MIISYDLQLHFFTTICRSSLLFFAAVWMSGEWQLRLLKQKIFFKEFSSILPLAEHFSKFHEMFSSCREPPTKVFKFPARLSCIFKHPRSLSLLHKLNATFKSINKCSNLYFSLARSIGKFLSFYLCQLRTKFTKHHTSICPCSEKFQRSDKPLKLQIYFAVLSVFNFSFNYF